VAPIGLYLPVDGREKYAPLVINPQNAAVLYAQAASRVFTSSNSGASWELKSQDIVTGENKGDVLSLRIAPSDPSVLYVSEITGHMYRTSDLGEMWMRTSPLLGERARTLTIDPGNTNTLYDGTISDGVYKTIDGGQSWMKRNQRLPNSGNSQMVNAILIDADRTRSMYASMNCNGLFKTTDAGLHWIRPTNFGQYNSIVTLVMLPNAANTIYAGYDGLGLYMTQTAEKSCLHGTRDYARSAFGGSPATRIMPLPYM